MTSTTKEFKSPLNSFFYFEKGSVAMIMHLVFPILLELILSTSFGMIDHMMAGQYSKDALNAIGLYGTPNAIFNVAFTAINVGTTVRVAWNIGAKKYQSARRVMTTSIKLNIIIGVIITALCMVAAPAAITFLAGDTYGSVNVKGTVASDAVDVFRICSAGIVFLVIKSAITSALRGAGENRAALIYNIAGSFLNVIGNYMFIYGVDFLHIPEMGAQGAALSTSLCHGFGCLFAVVYLCMSRNSKFGFRNSAYATDFDGDNEQQKTKRRQSFLLPDKEDTKKILAIGIPSAVESVIIQLGFLLLTKMIVSTGPDSYAAHQVTNSINSLFLIVGSAFSSAANTIVGQHMGAKDLKGIKYYVGAITKISVMISVVLAVVIALFAGGLVSLYTSDTAVMAISTKLLYICAVMLVFSNVLAVFSGALRGTGDTKYPVYVAMFSVLLLRVSLVFCVVTFTNFGIFGVWCVTLIDNAVRGILMIVRYKGGRWEKNIEKEA
jgi:putative MATE family efflux protein